MDYARLDFMRKLIIIIVLYLFIYNPVFTWFGFGFVNVLMGISLFYTVLEWRTVRLYLRSYKTEFVLSLIMLIYVSCICAINGTESIGMSLIIWIVSTVFVPIFLVEKLFHRNGNVAFFDIIISVGFIASLFSCAALFYPPFNSFLRSIQVSEEFTSFAETQFSYRYFGLAINLSNAYGYVQGIIASLCLLRLDRHHKRYLFYFFTILISIVVNARTGLFPIALTLLYIVTKTISKFDVRSIIRLLFGVVVFLSLIMYLLSLNREIGDFVLDFFSQIYYMFFSSDFGFKDSAYYTMIRGMGQWPQCAYVRILGKSAQSTGRAPNGNHLRQCGSHACR